ncbi:MAG: hydrolase TatD, partial [Gammaproteobacteria bacterium]|nr:hydrolase TatD [Gammaproteobacteria bacterium]
MNHPFSSLVDIGANLTHDSFDTDFDQVIERAQAAGVKTIMLTGTDLSTSQQA